MISRRSFLGGLLASGVLLTACRREHAPDDKAEAQLMHRFSLPDNPPEFRRLYAAGPPAEVMLYALAPERLVGWTAKKSPEALAFFGEASRKLPLLGGINGRGTTVSFERLLAEQVDLIVDVGTADETYLSTAARTSAQLSLPYVLLDGRLNQAAEQFRQLGSLIRSPHTDKLRSLAEAALAFAQDTAEHTKGTRIYYARGADGLETGRQSSIHTEIISLLGAENVGDALGAGGLAKVSLEQVVQWQPDWIFTQDAAFAAHALRDSAWQGVEAVRRGRVRVFPRTPFGWLDGPPGVNRLPGIYYLAAVLAGKPPAHYTERIVPLLEALYHRRPDSTQLRLLGLHEHAAA